MTEAIQGEVLHVVPPTELDEHDLTPSLQKLAESRYVIVLRKGGHPSLLHLLWAFIRRRPVEAVTVVTEQPYEEGDEVTLSVENTELAGVYVTADAEWTYREEFGDNYFVFFKILDRKPTSGEPPNTSPVAAAESI